MIAIAIIMSTVLTNLRDTNMEMHRAENSKIVLERCLKSLGFNIIAKDVPSQTNWTVLSKYVWIVQMKALKERRFDVLDDMELACLIYGY